MPICPEKGGLSTRTQSIFTLLWLSVSGTDWIFAFDMRPRFISSNLCTSLFSTNQVCSPKWHIHMLLPILKSLPSTETLHIRKAFGILGSKVTSLLPDLQFGHLLLDASIGDLVNHWKVHKEIARDQNRWNSTEEYEAFEHRWNNTEEYEAFEHVQHCQRK